MTTDHEPECNRAHTPRQRCNTPLRAAEQSRPDPVDDAPPTPVLLEVPAQLADRAHVGTVQAAIAAAEPHLSSSYVAAEWEKTVAAVSARTTVDANMDEEAQVDFAPSFVRRSRAVAPLVAVVGLAATAGALAYVRRRRGVGSAGRVEGIDR